MVISEDIFKAIFENSAAPTAIFNLDTTIAMANSAYCRVSGLSMDEVIGISWLSQIPPDDIERLKEYNKTRLMGSGESPDEYDFSFYNKRGDRKYGHTFVKLIKEHNLIICSFVDVTDKREAEILVEKQREELRLQVKKLDKELAFQAIQFSNFNNAIATFAVELQTLRKQAQKEKLSVLSGIEKLLAGVEQQQQSFSWISVKDRFLDTHPEFMPVLLDMHPNLTPAEIKLCTLLHLNLDTNEIAAITSQTYDSARTARTRLRKKLGLKTEDSLVAYLMQF